MILVINRSLKDARALAEMFHIMGTLAYGATPSDALSEISPLYAYVLVMNPSTLADKEDFVRRIRSYANVPVFAITNFADAIDKNIFDGIIDNSLHAPKILHRLRNNSAYNDIKEPGAYRLAGIDASIDLRYPMYFNKVLPLTKTETMILRALIVNYPTASKPKLIMKYAFKQTKLPELSNIRTHISIINKKFREITGRNLIESASNCGYRILTAEILEAALK